MGHDMDSWLEGNALGLNNKYVCDGENILKACQVNPQRSRISKSLITQTKVEGESALVDFPPEIILCLPLWEFFWAGAAA